MTREGAMTPEQTWTAIGVVCGPMLAIIAFMGRQIYDLRQERKEDKAIILALQQNIENLEKKQTDYLLRLVDAEKKVGDAERETKSARQDLWNLQYLHDRLHGGGGKR